jgi:hypothetical protein
MNRRIARLGRAFAACALILLLAPPAPVAAAAKPAWLELEAPRFKVISQLDETGTRAWADEFDRFFDALQQLSAVDESVLAPLTIVLFAEPEGFAPYRTRTESGQADVIGFFGNMGTWSVIGLPRLAGATRDVLYHEAVHWYLSGTGADLPLWYQEGIADALSTFRIEDGKGRWGDLVPEHVKYLRTAGLEPLGDFLRTSQDEALHGASGYYPQAWLLVHYLMFGPDRAGRSQLETFLRLERTTDLDAAFGAAFGRSYDELTGTLQAYLDAGKFTPALSDLDPRHREMTVRRAAPAEVGIALARLAVAGDNDDLARTQAAAAAAADPKIAAPFDLLALLADRAHDTAALTANADKAIALGSRDANVYAIKAFAVMEASHRRGAIDTMLPADAARAAADLLDRAIELQPRNRTAYQGLASALLNVETIEARDEAALAAGARAFPTDGVVPVAEAAVARRRGDPSEATRLLRRARAEPYTLPPHFLAAITSLYDSWVATRVKELTRDLGDSESVAAAQAFLDEQVADASIADSSRTRMAGLRGDLDSFARLHAAGVAGRQGRDKQARAMLAQLAADPNASERARVLARRALGIAE